MALSRSRVSTYFLSAQEALTRQAYRDLHAFDAPADGAELPLDRIAVLNVDLGHALASYQADADPGAYRRLRAETDRIESAVREGGGVICSDRPDLIVCAFAGTVEAGRIALHLRRSADWASPPALTVSLGAAAVFNERGLARLRRTVFDRADHLRQIAKSGDLLLDLGIAGDAAIQRLVRGADLVGRRREAASLPEGACEEVESDPQAGSQGQAA
ncbi:MAG: hypothetical protein EXQ85_01110 [Alphaproteobacteria bacterium]|nr:hypothetical protein [Alphaproteobacteria bacterium]